MSRKAFSIVELSIVLVIIGLVVGGLMVGSSLIRASEVNSVITTSQKYKTALLNFRNKYAGWPGDLRDATSYWGIRDGATGDDDTCSDAGTASGTATCNGDGNGLIFARSGTYFDERYLFWQHLANAGLVDGQYTGFGGTLAAEVRQPKVNMPAAPISGSYFMPYSAVPVSANAQYFDRDAYGTGVYFAGQPGLPLTPAEAWTVDSKIDDGLAGAGFIYTFKRSSTWQPNCADGDTTAAGYDVGNNAKLCTLHMLTE